MRALSQAVQAVFACFACSGAVGQRAGSCGRGPTAPKAPLASPGEKISWAGQGVFISGENIASHAVSKTRTTDADDS